MSDQAREETVGPDAEPEDEAEAVTETTEASEDSPRGSPEDRSPEALAEYAAELELGQQLDSLQAEFDTLNDRHLRLAAEFQNYRRRAESEMTGAWSRAQADLVRRFLDVLDDLQRVSALDPADDAVSIEQVLEGIDLVHLKFQRVLQDAGVEVVHPEGEPFDPETMEAMMRVPAESADEDERVHQVFQSGYLLKGQLIRPARVSVKKHE